MSNTNSEIKKRVAIGTLWMILLKVAVRGLGILSTLILARLLLPEDYGLVAMALAFYSLVEMLAAFGFDFVLVQKAQIDRDDYDSAFTAKLLCYSILSVLVICISREVSLFYGEPLLEPILYALAFQMFISGFDNIALVDFRREFLFDKEFKFQLVVKVIGFVVTVGLAYELRNYWALVIGNICLRMATVIFGYYFRPYMPRICFSRFKEIFGFSKWLLFMNFASYARNQLPNIVLGKFISPRAVGLYSIGAEIGQTVTQEIVAAMNRPVYSGFAKLSGNIEELQRNFLDVVGYQALIVFAFGFGVAATSELIVPVALGNNWLDLIEPLVLLAIGYTLSSISSCCIYIYMCLGQPRLCFVMALIGLIIFVPLVFLLLDELGLMGVVYAHLITSIITTCISYFIVSKLLRMSVLNILSVLLRPILGALIMYFSCKYYALPFISIEFTNIYLSLLATILCGALVYISVVIFLWVLSGRPKSAEYEILGLIKTKLPTF